MDTLAIDIETYSDVSLPDCRGTQVCSIGAVRDPFVCIQSE